ncbi:hypothetical protein THZG08_90063 [Vibrio owensii]|nr:hypothetical protein THZG08_90063 [Vibrio owensii]CAH1593849.1 hypothetical protein THOA03_90063 [Vibrio owensii]
MLPYIETNAPLSGAQIKDFYHLEPIFLLLELSIKCSLFTPCYYNHQTYQDHTYRGKRAKYHENITFYSFSRIF